jgi:cellulose 1,4-beta-cellobiosidase
LQGSTNGVNWVTVDTQIGQAFAARFQFNTYDLTNIVAFPYYRLNITTNNGNTTGIQLSELQFFGGNFGPQGLMATPGNAQATLVWTNLNGATSYNIKRSTISGSGYSTIASNVTTTSYTNTGVVNDTPYYYLVAGVNSIGQSPDSSEVSVTPHAPPQLTANLVAGANMTLSWPAWATNFAAYRATNLVPPIQWQLVTNVPQTNNGVLNLNLPTSEEQQFFKLGPP